MCRERAEMQRACSSALKEHKIGLFIQTMMQLKLHEDRQPNNLDRAAAFSSITGCMIKCTSIE